MSPLICVAPVVKSIVNLFKPCPYAKLPLLAICIRCVPAVKKSISSLSVVPVSKVIFVSPSPSSVNPDPSDASFFHTVLVPS